jgi:hypothetical protein
MATYATTRVFNRGTGSARATDLDAENFNTENKWKRQMNEFFSTSMLMPAVATGEIQTGNGAGRKFEQERRWKIRAFMGFEKIKRHNGLGHRMALAALLSVGCVGDGDS